MKRFYLTAAWMSGLLAAVSVSASEGNLISSPVVARPAAAVQVKWPRHEFCGRDYWIMLPYQWSEMKGVSQERFVRDAGWTEIGTPWKRTPIPRRTGISEIEIFQDGKNHTADAKMVFSSPEPDTLFYQPEFCHDGNRKTFGWIIGSTKDFRDSHKGVPFEIELTLSSDRPVEKIVIRTRQQNLGIKELSAWSNGKELESSCIRKIDSYTLDLLRPVPGGKLRLKGMTCQVVYQAGDLSPALQKITEGKPFTHTFKFRGKQADLSLDNIDRESVLRFRAKYPNFIPETVGEVSANFYQHRMNPKRFREALEKDGSIVSTYDRNRYEAEMTLRKNWARYLKVFGPLNMLEGGLSTMPYYYEWGTNLCVAEAMNENPIFSNRNLMLFNRSGARQYSRPWGFYQTTYGEATYASSRFTEAQALKLAKKQPWHPGEDFGVSPSYHQRIILLAYYQGVNLQKFETPIYGFARQNPDRTWSLTGNGKRLKDAYDWIVRPEGARGEFYAPVLLLNDYYYGNWEWKRGKQWNVWYMYPYEDGDYLLKHILDTIDPPVGDFKLMKERSNGMRNSRFGDIYDSFFANAPSGAVTEAELGKYPVVMLLGDIRPVTGLSENLKNYVRAGGTLIINSAQMALIDESFAGVRLSRNFRLSNQMKIMEAAPDGAEVLLQDSCGLPLVTRFRNGRGNVILTTPYHLLDQKNPRKPLPLIAALLRKIQSEVLPVGVDGDIHFCFNKMGGKDWKLILFNHKGTFKPTMGTKEEFFPEYAQEVKLTLPDGASARELRLNLPVRTDGNQAVLTVPPGETAVVELRNVNFMDEPISAEPIRRQPSRSSVSESRNPAQFFYSEAGEGAETSDTKKEGNALFYNGKTAVAWYIIPVKYSMTEGGYSCFAKPAGVRGRQVAITNRYTQAGIFNGRWYAFAYDGSRQHHILGPKAEAGKWTHLAVTWKDRMLHFYVNGKEIIPPDGPVMLNGSVSGVDGGRAGIYLGSHYYRRQNLFRGLIRAARFFGVAPDGAQFEREASAK